MNHLTQEELVLCYYGDFDGGAHLASCGECRNELRRIAATLDHASKLEIPEPEADYESRVWKSVQWRMRGEKKLGRRSEWMKWMAVAAVISLAFLAGLFWKRRPSDESYARQTTTTSTVRQVARQQQPVPAASTPAQRDRILFVVVGEHIDQSERILVELTNLRPEEGLDITAERDRAGALLASNRLYRQTAESRGEDSVATILDELEPVLLQIAHMPTNATADELRRIQERVEKKGLVLKLRVMRDNARASSPAPQQQPNV
jgi:hypothetical protein